MPYQIVRNDIVKMNTDAIVDPTDPIYSGSGGADRRIHAAAGPELRRVCDDLPLLEEGEVAVTPGFDLPCKYVIHAFGPVWEGGSFGEALKLASCYHKALEAARELGCESISFPLISSGTFGFPKDRVLHIALEAISEFLLQHDMTVYIVVYDERSFELGKRLQANVAAYIDEHYVAAHSLGFHHFTQDESAENEPESAAPDTDDKTEAGQKKPSTLNELLGEEHETFSEMLLRLITNSGMTDAECYKKANVDKRLFSKIRSARDYQPTKPTVLAFAFALKLSMDETKALLESAGLALTDSSDFDIIVKFFIESGNYNLFDVNEALFKYGQKTLGNTLE